MWTAMEWIFAEPCIIKKGMRVIFLLIVGIGSFQERERAREASSSIWLTSVYDWASLLYQQ